MVVFVLKVVAGVADVLLNDIVITGLLDLLLLNMTLYRSSDVEINTVAIE